MKASLGFYIGPLMASKWPLLDQAAMLVIPFMALLYSQWAEPIYIFLHNRSGYYKGDDIITLAALV